MRGGEKVLEVFAGLFPGAAIYTMVHVPGSVSPAIESHRIVTSGLQRLPFAARHYRRYLPLMPWYASRLRIEPVDLAISVSTCVAKGMPVPPGARHAAYVNTPMRYLYDRYDDYFRPGRAGWATRAAMRLLRHPLRRWDRSSAARCDSMAANSTFVASRIRRYYGRAATIIHPPVDVARFRAAMRDPQDFYLMVGALVPYKNISTAINAFRMLERRLIIVGSGPLYRQLKADSPPNVEVRGWVDDSEVAALVASCRAFLVTGVEDFGIAPVEAMAAGRPVVALGRGGVRDSVRDFDRVARGELAGPLGATGLFYRYDDPLELAGAVRRFERLEDQFDPDDISAWAGRFDRPRFEQEIRRWLDEVINSSGAAPVAAETPSRTSGA
jgi:glycosyltransferase involved in cell wall biosynthesis